MPCHCHVKTKCKCTFHLAGLCRGCILGTFGTLKSGMSPIILAVGSKSPQVWNSQMAIWHKWPPKSYQCPHIFQWYGSSVPISPKPWQDTDWVKLTHCGLVMPYGDIDLGQPYLVMVSYLIGYKAIKYLNQCWLLISEVLWHSPEGISTAQTSTETRIMYEFEIFQG